MPTDPARHPIGEQCEPEDHTPCDINVSVGYVQELVEAEGLAVPAFDDLLANGWRTTGDVVAAIEAVAAAVPPAAREEVAAVLGFLQDALLPPPQ